jgi:hypothetical protein
MNKTCLLFVLLALAISSPSILQPQIACAAESSTSDAVNVSKAAAVQGQTPGTLTGLLRGVALALTILAGALSLVDTLRLPRFGPYVRVLLALLVYIFPFFWFPVPSLHINPQSPGGATLLVLGESLLAVAGFSSVIALLFWAFSQLGVYKQHRAFRRGVWIGAGVIFAGGLLNTVVVACGQTILHTGVLVWVGLGESAMAGAIALLYWLSALLEKKLGERRSLVVLSVLTLCIASAIQLYGV